ncbi:MAG: AGE family epimerase/isomerase [Desulfobacteraceae bacterium]|jgi:mannobiose 2-epimerase
MKMILTDETGKGDLKDRFLKEVEQGILPFWLKYSLDEEHGGFYGRVGNTGQPVSGAPKALILNTRILWSFSAAYLVMGNPEYLKTADRAWNYLREYFIDTEYGGAYWILDCHGVPLDDKKKVYGQAFFVYALAEYYRAASKITALDLAVEFFNVIEKQFFDTENGGYFEAALRDWGTADDTRLSAIDLNEKKSMNAHLHVLEAYTNLLRVWDDPRLRQQLTALLNDFYNHIINKQTYHFNLFFNEIWEVKSQQISLGHDIEGSWLLCEAVELIDDKELKEEFHNLAVKQANAVYEKGINLDGSLIYDILPHGRTNMERHWWAQAEATVGFLNAWQLTGDKKFYRAMLGAWNYISGSLIDNEHGEWFYKRNEDGQVDNNEFKISEWKGPYHNTRACLEVVRRLSKKDNT